MTFTGLLIVLTLTTCRRPHLFAQTVRSIRENVTDIGLVSRWLVVDDGTLEKDRPLLLEATQWLGDKITFHWKAPEAKGHARSLNWLREQTKKADFVFHWEDDWRLVEKRAYVELTVRALQIYPYLGQVLLNENYREVQDNIHHIEGGLLLEPGLLVHHWRPHETQKVGSFYWPHYSLRPGMLKRKVWDTVGPYNESHSHFELEYANRYFHEHGYQTAFLEGVNCVHLGKKTWEREDEVASAYSLNEVSRFS